LVGLATSVIGQNQSHLGYEKILDLEEEEEEEENFQKSIDTYKVQRKIKGPATDVTTAGCKL